MLWKSLCGLFKIRPLPSSWEPAQIRPEKEEKDTRPEILNDAVKGYCNFLKFINVIFT
jgi:hypothetical protein